MVKRVRIFDVKNFHISWENIINLCCMLGISFKVGENVKMWRIYRFGHIPHIRRLLVS